MIKIIQTNSTLYRFFVIVKKTIYLHSSSQYTFIPFDTQGEMLIHPQADTIRAKRNERIPLGFVHVQGLHTEKMSITLALVGRRRVIKPITTPSPRSSTNYPLPATLYKFSWRQ